MRLINKNKGTPFADVGAYACELTDELDALMKAMSDASANRHYILADEFCKRNKCLAIRIPGCTLGGIHYNHDNIVTGIDVFPTNEKESILVLRRLKRKQTHPRGKR